MLTIGSSGVTKVQRIVVDLDIGPTEMARYYQGRADQVVARARDGRWVRFPLRVLRAVVTRGGVHGTFALVVEGRTLVGFETVPKTTAPR